MIKSIPHNLITTKITPLKIQNIANLEFQIITLCTIDYKFYLSFIRYCGHYELDDSPVLCCCRLIIAWDNWTLHIALHLLERFLAIHSCTSHFASNQNPFLPRSVYVEWKALRRERGKEEVEDHSPMRTSHLNRSNDTNTMETRAIASLWTTVTKRLRSSPSDEGWNQ